MTNIIEKLRRLLDQRKTIVEKHQDTGQIPATPASYQPPGIEDQALDAEILKNLMVMLEHTHEGMYTCEETFDLLDEYVELALQNDANAADIMPYVKKHLEMCPGCYEEYEILRHVIETGPAGEDQPG